MGKKGEKSRRAKLAEGFRAEKRNELFCLDLLARDEKMEGFQIFFA